MISTATTARRARTTLHVDGAIGEGGERGRLAVRGRAVATTPRRGAADSGVEAANARHAGQRREVGVEQPLVDAEVLAVGACRDGVAPSLARHGGQGRSTIPGGSRHPVRVRPGRSAAALRGGGRRRRQRRRRRAGAADRSRRCGSCAPCSVRTARSRISCRRRTCGPCARCRGSGATRRCGCGCCRSPGAPAPTTSAAGSGSAACRPLDGEAACHGRPVGAGRRRRRWTCSAARPRPARGVRPDAARRAQLRGGGDGRRLPDRHDPLARRPGAGATSVRQSVHAPPLVAS